jgi:hypothetical protein
MPLLRLTPIGSAIALLCGMCLSVRAQEPLRLYPIIVGAEPGTYDKYYVDGKNGLLGFIDRSGKVVIAARLTAGCGRGEQLREFHEGLAAVAGPKGFGYIDEKGDFVIPSALSRSDPPLLTRNDPGVLN